MTIDPKEVLTAKLAALSVALCEAAAAVRQYRPDDVVFRRHSKELECAAQKVRDWSEGLHT